MRFGRTLIFALALAACGSAGGPAAGPAIDIPRVTRIEDSMGRVIEIERVPERVKGTVHLVRVEPDRAWEVLPDVYESIGLPANTADFRSRIVGVLNQRMPRRVAGKSLVEFVDCGMKPEGPNALVDEVTLSVVTRLQPDGQDATLVETTVQGSAKPRSVSGNPVRCTSKGVLERVIADRIAWGVSQRTM